MSGLALAITVEDSLGVAELEALASRVEHKGPMMARVAGYLESSTLERFETQSAPGGAPWVPSMRARLQGGQTLTDTGHMRGTIASVSDDESAEVGSNHPFIHVHHFGAVIRAKNGPTLRFALPGGGYRSPRQVTLPARPILGVDDADRTAIAAIVTSELTGGAP